MSSNCIDLSGVAKRFGRTEAVRDLDLQVPSGSLCGFLGPNGAGKSTTIRMIMSIIRPDTGSLRVLDGDALDHKDRIGYLPEERGVYRKMKVGDYLRYIGRLKGVESARLPKIIDDALERIELPGVARKRCEELSKGMQQKVQFLAAIIHEPELIILDEPFSGLDPVNAMLLNDLIRELHEQGRTILFSTHVLHQAERMCDRIVMIDRGRKVLDDRLDRIRERFDPRTVVVEPLGDPTTLESMLRATPEVESVTIDAEDRLHARLRDLADADRIMARAIEHGPLRSVGRAKTTLDEVFIGLVERPDESGAAGETTEPIHA